MDKLFELAANLILMWDASDVVCLRINITNLDLGSGCPKAKTQLQLTRFWLLWRKGSLQAVLRNCKVLTNPGLSPQSLGNV